MVDDLGSGLSTLPWLPAFADDLPLQTTPLPEVCESGAMETVDMLRWLTSLRGASSVLLLGGVLYWIAECLIRWVNWKAVVDVVSNIFKMLRSALRIASLLSLLAGGVLRLIQRFSAELVSLPAWSAGEATVVVQLVGSFFTGHLGAATCYGICKLVQVLERWPTGRKKGSPTDSGVMVHLLRRIEEMENAMLQRRAEQGTQPVQRQMIPVFATTATEAAPEEDVELPSVPEPLPEDVATEGQRMCIRCMRPGHTAATCRLKGERCYNCGKLGHLAVGCKNFAVKDNRGRVQTLVEPRPGSTNVRYRQDRTNIDKMTTAESIITMLRELAADRSRKAQVRRKGRNPSAASAATATASTPAFPETTIQGLYTGIARVDQESISPLPEAVEEWLVGTFGESDDGSVCYED